MARKTAALKPKLNIIRSWAEEGSTDAWIAHQLGTTADVVAAFRAEQGIGRDAGAVVLSPVTPDTAVAALAAEDSENPAPKRRRTTKAAPDDAAAIAADTEGKVAEDDEAPKPRARRTRKPVVEAPEDTVAVAADGSGDEQPAPRTRRPRRAPAIAGPDTEVADEHTPEPEADDLDASDEPGDDEDDRPARRRRRRGGRGRSRRIGGTGARAQIVQGSVLILDHTVAESPLFREYWGTTSGLTVEVTAETIVLRRAAGADDSGSPAS